MSEALLTSILREMSAKCSVVRHHFNNIIHYGIKLLHRTSQRNLPLISVYKFFLAIYLMDVVSIHDRLPFYKSGSFFLKALKNQHDENKLMLYVDNIETIKIE